MANKVVRGGGAAPAPADPTPSPAAVAAVQGHAVFKKGPPCKKCGGTGKVKYEDPRKIETVHTCQDCQPGM